MVMEKKAIIPFVKYTGGVGRKGMAKQVNAVDSSLRCCWALRSPAPAAGPSAPRQTAPRP